MGIGTIKNAMIDKTGKYNPITENIIAIALHMAAVTNVVAGDIFLSKF